MDGLIACRGQPLTGSLQSPIPIFCFNREGMRISQGGEFSSHDSPILHGIVRLKGARTQLWGRRLLCAAGQPEHAVLRQTLLPPSVTISLTFDIPYNMVTYFSVAHPNCQFGSKTSFIGPQHQHPAVPKWFIIVLSDLRPPPTLLLSVKI